MWTDLTFISSEQKKRHKHTLDKCQRFIERCDNDKDWYLEYKGKKLDAFESISYIISRYIGDNPQNVLSKNMTMKQVEFLSVVADRLKKDGIFRGSSTYMSSEKQKELDKRLSFEKDSKQGSDEDKITNGMRYGLGDNPNQVYTQNILVSYAMTKSEYAANMIEEALVFATLNMDWPNNDEVCVTPAFIHSTIVMYWANKNMPLFKNNSGEVMCLKRFTQVVSKSESFEGFLKAYINNDKVFEHVDKYMMELVNGSGTSKAFYRCIEDFVEIARIQYKKSNLVKEMLDGINQQIEGDFECEETSACTKMAGRKNIKTMCFASFASSYVGCDYNRNFPPETAVLYLLKQFYVNGDTKCLSKTKAEAIHAIACEHGNFKVREVEANALSSLYWASPKLVGEVRKVKENAARTEQRVEVAESKTADYRRVMREAQKENKQLNKQVAELQSTVNRLQKISESNISQKDFEELQGKLELARDKIKALQYDIGEQARNLNKKDREIEDLEDKLDRQETDYLELLEKHDRLDELNSQLSVHRVFNSVPIECFINAIKGKRIALIGGDMMHEKIRKYGMDNITLYKCNCRDISNEDIINKDLVVLATAYLDHASTTHVPKLAKQYGVPILHFNDKNVDMLVYALFEELNK